MWRCRPAPMEWRGREGRDSARPSAQTASGSLAGRWAGGHQLAVPQERLQEEASLLFTGVTS